MTLCSDIVARARRPLNDEDPTSYRHQDTELMQYLNDGIARAFALRPDLQFATLGTPFSPLALGGTFPLPIQHESVLGDYIVFRAEMKDDEAVNSQRAAMSAQLFERGITTT